MIFYHKNNLYKQKEGFHKFICGAWIKVNNSFELYEIKEKYNQIRNNILEGCK